MLLNKSISKRRILVFLVILTCKVLLSLSYNFIKPVLSCYASNLASSALQASLLIGAGFGILSVVAASAVAIPAILVDWITVLVLLRLAGKSKRTLVLEGKKLSVDIIGLVVKFLIKEGSVVALISAVFGFLAFLLRGRDSVCIY